MVQVEVDADLDKERRQKKLTLSADTFTATQVLDHISEEVGLSWAVEDRRIVLCEPARAYDLRQRTARIGVLAEKEVHLNYRNRPLHQVVSDLAKQIEAPVHVERSLWEPDHPRVSLDVDAEQLRWALEDLCEAVGARHLIDADAVYLLSP
jgi:type II secretory pathway component GspD/PulD (secretin)